MKHRNDMFKIEGTPSTLMAFLQTVADEHGVGHIVDFEVDTELLATEKVKFEYHEYMIVGTLKDKEEDRYNWTLEVDLKEFWLFSSKLANEHARFHLRRLSKHNIFPQTDTVMEWCCVTGKKDFLNPGNNLRRDVDPDVLLAVFGEESVQQEVLIKGVGLFLDKFLSDARYQLSQQTVEVSA